MVRIDDYAELAALVAEREEQREALMDAGEEGPEHSGETDTRQAGTASGTVYAPLFTARAVVAGSAAQLLVTWADEDLQQLARDTRAQALAWAHGLDVCARQAGHAVSQSQVVAEAPAAISAMLGNQASLDRLLVRRYRGLGRPARLVSGAQLGHHDDQQYWVVSEKQAAAWKRARR